jgi:hypothetical protein
MTDHESAPIGSAAAASIMMQLKCGCLLSTPFRSVRLTPWLGAMRVPACEPLLVVGALAGSYFRGGMIGKMTCDGLQRSV